MYELKIRKIPAEVEAKLKEEARNHHMGVEPYVRNLLTNFALHPDLIAVESRYETLVKDVTALYQTMLKELSGCVERNTYAMETILKEVERGRGK